ncbi:serine protease easter-like [Anoplophora glabripennis]|uniref:serine protease easter-like n=1 Tax=Anoplophora glabripennis TaxID=217634 RepID=UPI0008754080|nr:serine protease easter-like [Anoplophora glabripennis]
MNYFFIFMLSAYFLIVQGKPMDTQTWENEENCGLTMYDNGTFKLTKRGNRKVAAGEFPWLVRIGVIDVEANEPVFHCEGALIHRQIVISATDCGTVNQVARVGENNIDENVDCELSVCPPPPQDIKIRKHTVADNSNDSGKSEISIIELEAPVEYNDFVRPICLSQEDIPLPNIKAQRGTGAKWGWGDTLPGLPYVNNATSSRSLIHVKTHVLDKEECRKSYVPELDEDHYCVEYPQEEPCAVPLGAPLIAYKEVKGVNRAFLVSVASHNQSTCKTAETRPVVYKRAGRFIFSCIFNAISNLFGK